MYVHMYSQIQEMDIPGVMEVWALIGSDLHRMKVTVPRTFYVNCRSPKSIEGDAVCECHYPSIVTCMCSYPMY